MLHSQSSCNFHLVKYKKCPFKSIIYIFFKGEQSLLALLQITIFFLFCFKTFWISSWVLSRIIVYWSLTIILWFVKFQHDFWAIWNLNESKIHLYSPMASQNYWLYILLLIQNWSEVLRKYWFSRQSIYSFVDYEIIDLWRLWNHRPIAQFAI